MKTNYRDEYAKDIRMNNHWGRIEAKRIQSKLKEAMANGDKEISIKVGSAESIMLLLMYYCDSKLFDEAYCEYQNSINEHVEKMLSDVRNVTNSHKSNTIKGVK